MSFGFCWDERDHQRRAERDAQYHHQDRDYYDRYTTDPCKEAYTEAYDREIRSMERREEERQQQEEAGELRRLRYRQEEREMEELIEEQYPEPTYADEPICEHDLRVSECAECGKAVTDERMRKFAELIAFCQAKEQECRKLVESRTEMAAGWKIGSNDEWRETARRTGLKYIPLLQRHGNAERDARIASRYSAEADTYAAISAVLSAVEGSK